MIWKMNTKKRKSQTVKKYTTKTFKPDGAWYGMPMAAYQSAPGLSSSRLKLLLESPLTYRRVMDGLIEFEPSHAMNFGTILHSAILEGRLDYQTRPETYGPDNKPWNGNAKECKAWLADNPNRLSASESAFVSNAFSYVRTHPKVIHSKLLTEGRSEVSVFATIGGRLFKGRFDYYKPGTITDLKSVADAEPASFAKTVIRYGWHLQAALYTKLAEAIGDKPTFNWIALQKGEMPLVNVCRFGMFSKLIGDEALDRALAILDRCEKSNVWPDWADDDSNEIKPLAVPEWAMRQDEETDISSGTMKATEL